MKTILLLTVSLYATSAMAEFKTSSVTKCQQLSGDQSIVLLITSDFAHCLTWGSAEECKPVTSITLNQDIEADVKLGASSNHVHINDFGCETEVAYIQTVLFKGPTARSAQKHLFACHSSENICHE